jgi:hypothetical protein
MIQILIALGNAMQQHECNNHDTSRAPATIEPKNSLYFDKGKRKVNKGKVTPEF